MILDRDIDLVTPMCTPLTYEALIDELIGITNTYVSIELEGDGGGDGVSGGAGREDGGKKRAQIALNSNDALFGEIRTFNIAVLMKFLNDRAKQLREMRETVHNTSEVSELKAFVKKMPQLQKDMQNLSHHIEITQKILATTNQPAFRDRWYAERSILEGESNYDYIEECISKKEGSLQKILRLMCLQSLVANGLPSKRFDHLRREMQHTYGYEVLFTLDNLERVGMFKRQKSSGNWSTVRKLFGLIKDDVSAAAPDDVAYVTSGYAPISVRVVEMAIAPGGWTKNADKLKQLSATPMVEYHHRPEDGVDVAMPDGGRRKTMMVFYNGGVTYGEIAALRFVASQSACPYNIIIATTKIINGDAFVKSLLHEFRA